MRFLRSFVATALTGFLGAALLSCTSSTTITEPTTGIINGIVKDEAGNPVRGVKIRFINTTQINDVLSDSMGIFLIREVTVGIYDMNVYTPANYILAPSQPSTTPVSITDGQTLRPQITLRSSPGAPAAPGVAFVKMINFVFEPEVVRINRGGTVTWQNIESDPHTATSEIGNEIASPSVRRQERYVHTFNTPGVYQYRCAFHEVMQGTIIVE